MMRELPFGSTQKTLIFNRHGIIKIISSLERMNATEFVPKVAVWKRKDRIDHLEGKTEGILKPALRQASPQWRLPALEAELHGPPGLLPFVAPSRRLSLPRSDSPPLTLLFMLPPGTVLQVVQPQQGRRRHPPGEKRNRELCPLYEPPPRGGATGESCGGAGSERRARGRRTGSAPAGDLAQEEAQLLPPHEDPRPSYHWRSSSELELVGYRVLAGDGELGGFWSSSDPTTIGFSRSDPC